uniref:ARAD1A09042p n=1 Tax=Blastobotrys adeninivorans TaxID=409370 RepID=A0A060T3E1_BLAAD
MIRTNPSLNQLLRSCIQAEYKITPPPLSLSKSLPIYAYFKDLGRLIHYRQDYCPVTKRRLDGIKMIFVDPQGEEQSYRDNLIHKGKVVDRIAMQNLTDLEKKLYETTSLLDGKYLLDLKFLTRSPQSITMMRNTTLADSLGVPKQGTVDERMDQAESKLDRHLQGFVGLFDK